VGMISPEAGHLGCHPYAVDRPDWEDQAAHPGGAQLEDSAMIRQDQAKLLEQWLWYRNCRRLAVNAASSILC